MSTAVGTPWTELLREAIADDARTRRAQRLATTFTWCAMGLLTVVLVTALTVAILVQGTVGWVPLAGAAVSSACSVPRDGWPAAEAASNPKPTRPREATTHQSQQTKPRSLLDGM